MTEQRLPESIQAIRRNPGYFRKSLDRAIEALGPKDAYGYLRQAVEWMAKYSFPPDPMTEPLTCSSPGCDAIHPNAVAADASLAGWRCAKHERPARSLPIYAELVEVLADLEHQRWSHWERYRADNDTIANEKRWERQCETPYEELPEREKESDREFAREILDKLISINALHCLHPWQRDEGFGGDLVFEIKAQEEPIEPLAGQDYELPNLTFQTGAGAFGGPHGAFIFKFGDDENNFIKLTPDGQLEHGKRYGATEAARDFWHRMAGLMPLEAGTVQRCALVAKSKATNAKMGCAQALHMGNGNLAVSLDSVARAFEEYAADIEGFEHTALSLTQMQDALYATRHLIEAVRRQYAHGDYEVEDPDHMLDALNDIFVHYEQLPAKFRIRGE
jgi:hypothetical protein